ncbi:hypothetical protein HK101_010852 [Irineochytrium annulatum]|nr:hypothetical protein HK101_010852 [Irineochytrium annulatum]
MNAPKGKKPKGKEPTKSIRLATAPKKVVLKTPAQKRKLGALDNVEEEVEGQEFVEKGKAQRMMGLTTVHRALSVYALWLESKGKPLKGATFTSLKRRRKLTLTAKERNDYRRRAKIINEWVDMHASFIVRGTKDAWDITVGETAMLIAGQLDKYDLNIADMYCETDVRLEWVKRQLKNKNRSNGIKLNRKKIAADIRGDYEKLDLKKIYDKKHDYVIRGWPWKDGAMFKRISDMSVEDLRLLAAAIRDKRLTFVKRPVRCPSHEAVAP